MSLGKRSTTTRSSRFCIEGQVALVSAQIELYDVTDQDAYIANHLTSEFFKFFFTFNLSTVALKNSAGSNFRGFQKSAKKKDLQYWDKKKLVNSSGQNQYKHDM